LYQLLIISNTGSSECYVLTQLLQCAICHCPGPKVRFRSPQLDTVLSTMPTQLGESLSTALRDITTGAAVKLLLFTPRLATGIADPVRLCDRVR
jgi:hypothetical protein